MLQCVFYFILRATMCENAKQKDMTKLMGHIIAGYPNMESSLYAALGISLAGASYLEVQFPFSDPNADGVVIEEACDKSIAEGFTLSAGFELLSTLSNRLSQLQDSPTKLIIVTYANLIFHSGMEKFIKEAKKLGVFGILVPDLPIESDENLRTLAKKHHIAIICLITPKTPIARMKKIAKVSDEIVYVVARSGITGDKTELDQAFFRYLADVKKHCKKPIALGFGINSHAQVASLEGKVDIVVAGSYFVRFISELSIQNLAPQSYQDQLTTYAKSLMGWD